MSEAATSRRLLPVPIGGHPDVGELLSALATDRTPRIDVLVGPGDTGKSALVRSLALEYRQLGDAVRLVDLSLVDRRSALLGDGRVDVMFVDHIDRLAEPEHFRAPFEILDRGIPALFASGLSRLVLTVGTDWRENFRTLYRLPPETLLSNAVSGVSVAVHVIRPYSDGELVDLCKRLRLDPAMFAELSLRRSGVLSLAAVAYDDRSRLTGPCLRDVLACRWIEAGNGARSSDARRAMWDLLGLLTLRNEAFSFPLPDLSAALNAYENEMLRAQVGGPLRLEGNRVEWSTPAWGDVAGANALRAVIRDPSIEPIARPVRSSVLQALLQLSDRQELAHDVDQGMRALRGSDLTTQGYLGAALGTLSAQVAAGTELVFEELPLQGPDHSQLRPIHGDVAQVVRDALLDAMSTGPDRLVAALRSDVRGTRSGFRGGYECWSVAREWASRLPLRAFAEGALMHVPGDGAWRYEDILDVAVTGATTIFMGKNAGAITSALGGQSIPLTEYLADVWDGVNDGAWDQIDASAREYVGSLYLPQEMGKTLKAIRCTMQRAHFGTQDARGWRFIECDLLLADFRSCRNVEDVDFSGSNWWSAILPPPARYFLSRDCQTSAYFNWCQSPPWRNPYYTTEWPIPFEQRT